MRVRESNESRSTSRSQWLSLKGDYGLGRFENNDKGRYEVLERTV